MPLIRKSAYPEAPESLVSSWENTVSLQQNPTVDRRSGGTEARNNLFQINRSKESWQIRVPIVGMSNYFEIENFLKGRSGQPFYFNGKLWSVSDGSWTWTYKGGFFENATNELTVNLMQSFRP